MKKKQYIKPTTVIVEMKQQQILCTSQLYIYDENQYTTEDQW